MARKKSLSGKKQQLGQFMTPENLSIDIISKLEFNKTDKVLEPSFGNGSFIIPLIEKFIPLYNGTIEDKLEWILNYNIWGYEIDEEMYEDCLDKIYEKWSYIPNRHNLHCMDFLVDDIRVEFDYVVGNPPFGGTINPEFQVELERFYGRRDNMKIKKETYSYFIVKSIELLSEDGRLIFICSDTFKTIKTMEGLRKWMFSNGSIKIDSLSNFSDETNYPMVILDFTINKMGNHILVDNSIINIDSINLTPNFSWSVDSHLSDMFTGKFIGDFMVCSGGLTTGKNEYFIREINADNTIVENYEFSVFDDYITVICELGRAKNNMLSKSKMNQIREMEHLSQTKTNVHVEKTTPKIIQLPNKNYQYYNVATSDILWSNPTKVIYWKDDGEVVRTYKKNGNWYLGGMGGEKFYNKEGMTWQLISSRIKSRYLPTGYIIDNGSPIGILKDSIDKLELYFIIAWTLSDKCNNILKTVLNHTKNIQNKDIERLPYPTWVTQDNKDYIIDYIKMMITNKMNGIIVDDTEMLEEVNRIF